MVAGDEILKFGKYKGRKLRDIDSNYLQWLLRQSVSTVNMLADFLAEPEYTAQYWKDECDDYSLHNSVLEAELDRLKSRPARPDYSAIRRKYCFTTHPDRGGSNEAFRLVMNIFDELEGK